MPSRPYFHSFKTKKKTCIKKNSLKPWKPYQPRPERSAINESLPPPPASKMRPRKQIVLSRFIPVSQHEFLPRGTNRKRPQAFGAAAVTSRRPRLLSYQRVIDAATCNWCERSLAETCGGRNKASERRAARFCPPVPFFPQCPSEVKLIFFGVLKQTGGEGKNRPTVERDRGPYLSQRPQTVFWPKNMCRASL